GDERPQRRVLSPQVLSNPFDRHTGLAHVPDRLLVLLREPSHTNTSRSTASNARQSGWGCVDHLRTHRFEDARPRPGGGSRNDPGAAAPSAEADGTAGGSSSGSNRAHDG